MMTDHQHVQVFVERVHGIRHRRIRARREDVGLRAYLEDVGRVSAAGPFAVIRVNRPTLERRDRVFDETGFVQRVGMNGDLHVVFVGDRQRGIDRGGRRAPVLVELQSHGAGQDLLDQRLGLAALPFPRKPKFIGSAFGGLEHPVDVPLAGRARRRARPSAGPVPPPIIVVTPL